MVPFIDTHSHIYLHDFDADREEVIARALKAGLKAMLLPNVDLETIEQVDALSDGFPDLAFPMMGLHPTSVDAEYKSTLAKIEAILPNRTYHAIGEIGLDLYWDKTFAREQVDAFEEQMRWAMELNLPVAIHTRSAQKEVFDCVHRVGDARLRGVFHCFSGDADDLKEIDGFKTFMIGIGGVVTFKNSGLASVLRAVPMLDKLLIETDAPYLAPVPYRGKRNEPAYIPSIVDKLAEVYDVDREKLLTTALDNTYRLFDTLPTV